MVGAAFLTAFGLAAYHLVLHLRARSHLDSATQALERWDFKQARADLAFCLEVWPGDGATRCLAAQAARRAGHYDEAEEHLRACERLGYRNPGTALESAMLRAQRGEVAEVEELLLGCVQHDDLDSPLILEALALGHVHVYNLPRAGHLFDLLLERQPRNTFALLWRARCLEGINLLDKALEGYRQVLDIDPDHHEARLALADRIAKWETRYPEAIEHFERLRARRPDDLRVVVGLARCRRQTGETQEAVRLLDGILVLHPDDPEALGLRGQLALDAGRPAEAEGYLLRAVAKPPPDRHALYALSRSLEAQGKKDQAKETLARLERVKADLEQMETLLRQLAKAPEELGLYCELARLCVRNNKHEEAVRWLLGALSRGPGHAPAHDLLADIYEQKGNAALAAHHRQLAATGKGL